MNGAVAAHVVARICRNEVEYELQGGHQHHCVTSGLNLTENRRFEFAVAAAAGAVD
jgi:hypothetical protein